MEMEYFVYCLSNLFLMQKYVFHTETVKIIPFPTRVTFQFYFTATTSFPAS